MQFAVPRWAGTRPYQQLVFQWSCHVEDAAPASSSTSEFLDTSGEPPMRGAAEALVAALGDDGPIFVYHDFEKWRLVEMAQLFPDLGAPLEAITGRLVDLLRLTRDHYAHPALNGSYSLKTVLPTIDPASRPRRCWTTCRTASPRRPPFTRPWTPGTPADRREAVRRCAPRVLRPRHAGAGDGSLTVSAVAERSTMDHRTEIEIDGSSVTTLADIVPRARAAARALRRQDAVAGERRGGPLLPGAAWARGCGSVSTTSGLLHAATGEFADDILLDNGFGMTDICKLPRPFGEEPSQAEYADGWERVNGLVVAHCGRASSRSCTRARSTRCSSTRSAGSTRAATASTTTSCAPSGAACSPSRCRGWRARARGAAPLADLAGALNVV